MAIQFTVENMSRNCKCTGNKVACINSDCVVIRERPIRIKPISPYTERIRAKGLGVIVHQIRPCSSTEKRTTIHLERPLRLERPYLDRYLLNLSESEKKRLRLRFTFETTIDGQVVVRVKRKGRLLSEHRFDLHEVSELISLSRWLLVSNKLANQYRIYQEMVELQDKEEAEKRINKGYTADSDKFYGPKKAEKETIKEVNVNSEEWKILQLVGADSEKYRPCIEAERLIPRT